MMFARAIRPVREFCLLPVAVLMVALAAPCRSDETTPIVTDEQRHLAINQPDRFAWMLFTAVNRQVEGDPEGRVEWERWALAEDVFANPNQAPQWPQTPAPRLTEDLERIPLQQANR